MSEDKIDRWVVRDVVADGQVDPVALRRKVRATLSVVLN